MKLNFHHKYLYLYIFLTIKKVLNILFIFINRKKEYKKQVKQKKVEEQVTQNESKRPVSRKTEEKIDSIESKETTTTNDEQNNEQKTLDNNIIIQADNTLWKSKTFYNDAKDKNDTLKSKEDDFEDYLEDLFL